MLMAKSDAVPPGPPGLTNRAPMRSSSLPAGTGEAEREGVACRGVVVDRDLEGAAVGAAAVLPPDRVLAAAAGLVGVGRHARQVIVGRCEIAPGFLGARGRDEDEQGGQDAGEAQVAAEHPLTVSGSTPLSARSTGVVGGSASIHSPASPIRGSPPPCRGRRSAGARVELVAGPLAHLRGS